MRDEGGGAGSIMTELPWSQSPRRPAATESEPDKMVDKSDTRQHRRLRGNVCKLPHKEAHMATNLAIDPALLERALEVSLERTKKAAVTRALQEFIARRKQRHVAELLGKLEWDDSYEYKAERSRRA